MSRQSDARGPSRSSYGWPGYWRPRGLALNEAKTRTVRLTDGFDFLGFHVRRYRTVSESSTAAIRRIKDKLRQLMRSLRGYNAAEVIRVVSPVVRGYAACYRHQASSRVFVQLEPCDALRIWVFLGCHRSTTTITRR